VVAVRPICPRASKPAPKSDVGTGTGEGHTRTRTFLLQSEDYTPGSTESRLRSSPKGRATGWACSAGRGLLICPSRDLRSEPELDATIAEVDDGAGHVFIAALVQAHAVAV
jgi:hypothetical protein